MKTLRSIVKYKKGRPPKASPDGVLPILTPQYLRTGIVEDLAELTGREVVLSGGELVLLWDGSNAGEFFRARHGVLSSTMVVFTCDECEIERDYLFYELKRFEPTLKAKTAGSGIPHVDKEILLSHPVFERDVEEQRVVVNVLGTADRTITNARLGLAKLRRLMAGLIHDLLTHGLDAQGLLRDPATHRFKNSPLGLIPYEWTVVPVAELCSDVVDCPHSTPQYLASGTPCIRTADMLPGELLLDQAFRVDEATYCQRVVRLRPQQGDIIYSREGERLGIASQVGRERVCLGQRVMLLRPKKNTDPDFLLWSLNNPLFYRRVVLGLGATTSPHINVEDIRKALILRPEPDEQKMIGYRLGKHFGHILSSRSQLAKLTRIKNGLIQDLLTGHVSVEAFLSAATEQVPG